MIFFDVTKTGRAGHRSGLQRVSARLREELGASATLVSWSQWDRKVAPGDWYLTSEVFSADERPGFAAFLAERPCRLAAIYHDAIPLRLPAITWPHSVARHPGYLKQLAQFHRVWAVSEASAAELREFWRWQEVDSPPPVEVLALGADFNRAPRVLSPGVSPAGVPRLLSVGILEPRKNQALLLDVAEELWTEGRAFELRLVGRVNPHFGGPLVDRIQSLRSRFPGLHHDAQADDAALASLYATARATLLPTIAEGCGLPLWESLWQAVPCLCSDLPVLEESARGGGCVPLPVNDRRAWREAVGRILTDDSWRGQLAAAAVARPLPRWAEAAAVLSATLT